MTKIWSPAGGFGSVYQSKKIHLHFGAQFYLSETSTEIHA